MIGAVARKLFGSANDRRIRGYQPRVAAINALEKELEALSDEALKARTGELKQRLADGASLDMNGVTLSTTNPVNGADTLEDINGLGGIIGNSSAAVATLTVSSNSTASGTHTFSGTITGKD